MRLFPALALLLLCPLGCLAKAEEREEAVPAATWDAGVRGGVPTVATARTVAAEAIEQAGVAAIQAAIDAIAVPGAVELPAGRFLLEGPIEMRSGVVLRGQGAGATHLQFDFAETDEFEGVVQPAFGAIRFAGSRTGLPFEVQAGLEQGSQQVVMSEGAKLRAGDRVLLSTENDPDRMYTQARWNAPWAIRSLAQILRVEAVEGARVTFDVPLRIDFEVDLHPTLEVLDPIRGAGLEDLMLESLNPDSGNLIGFEVAEDCWIRRCETVNTSRGHIWMNFSRFLTVAGNEVHHATDYGGGGNGYGIVAGNVAVDCLVTDNVLHHLRHALMAKRGSNGNVFSYNYSHTRQREPAGAPLLCDISIHGHYPYQNLFEGNVVEFIELADFWGPTGPRTTFLRNRVLTQIEVSDHSHDTFLLGNVIVEGGIKTDGTSERLVQRGNTVGVADTATRVDPGTVPPSLYRATPPPGWGCLPWPAIGPGTVNTLPANPAQARARAAEDGGGPATVTTR